ncbi:MAG: bifunctional methylenetetrahydrofolate dehydrogenase/methenyltetrahydrofolate cyclohydrolase FolD [Oscillospiraceae bacterium]|nr:bifunctional methylenetetrahydrofolate dehydrogenase/methenyltetrahydrofolate cyclohydrolase FolD [Oscillospiraceae bacterium]
MQAEIINGKEISEFIKGRAAKEAEKCKVSGREPCLAVILAGDDPASQIYVKNKRRACEECGIRSLQYTFGADVSEEELLGLIETLNSDETVDGILCQLPLPSGIDEAKITNAISPEKDVDGFHPVNVGKMLSGKDCFLPCTPAGIIEMLKYKNIEISGKNAVVIGRSNIVGKPVSALLLAENATVTVCHSKTKNLKETVKTADIVVAAIGKPKFITADMLKEGCTVIDVGINRTENGKLCGDVDFENAVFAAGAITPVPGGVGPMTIAMLMQNTVKSCKSRLNFH